MSKSPRRALILIDVQNEYVTGNLLIEYPDVRLSLRNIATAAAAANAAGIPIVVVQNTAPPTAPIFVKGTPGWELHPDVGRRLRHAVWHCGGRKRQPLCGGRGQFGGEGTPSHLPGVRLRQRNRRRNQPAL